MELVAKNVRPFKDNKNAPQSLSIWVTRRVNSLKIGRKDYVEELGIKIHSRAGAEKPKPGTFPKGTPHRDINACI